MAVADTHGPVLIRIEDTVAGLWCRVTGIDDTGQPLTCSGAIVGGPDLEGDLYAVAVRDYRGGPDQVVYVPVDGHVVLVDEKAEHDARRAHAVAPVFPAGAERVDWLKRVGKRWVDDEPVFDVTEQQLRRWETSTDQHRMVSAVHRPHLPISKN